MCVISEDQLERERMVKINMGYGIEIVTEIKNVLHNNKVAIITRILRMIITITSVYMITKLW